MSLPHGVRLHSTIDRRTIRISAVQQQEQKQQRSRNLVYQFDPPWSAFFRVFFPLQATIRIDTARFARCSHDENGAGGNR